MADYIHTHPYFAALKTRGNLSGTHGLLTRYASCAMSLCVIYSPVLTVYLFAWLRRLVLYRSSTQMSIDCTCGNC